MEYDRALYRVYERILEDLGDSQSIFHSELSLENDSRRGSNNNNRRSTIPFLLPQSIVRFRDSIRRYGLRGSYCPVLGFHYHLCRRFWIFRRRPSEYRSEVEVQDTTSFSSNVELTPLTETNTNSENGLRRRTQTRSNSTDDSGIMEGTNISVQDQDDMEANISSTSRMAQNIALSQQERRRRHQDQRDRESNMCTQRGLYTFMRFSFLFAIWNMLVLACLHFTYVGPRISKTVHNHDRILSTATSSQLQQTCIESALSTRPESERSNFFRMSEEQDIPEKQNSGIFPLNKNDMQSIGNSTSVNATVPLLGRDEILQIKIIYDNRCSENDCSRVRTVIPSKHKFTVAQKNH